MLCCVWENWKIYFIVLTFPFNTANSTISCSSSLFQPSSLRQSSALYQRQSMDRCWTFSSFRHRLDCISFEWIKHQIFQSQQIIQVLIQTPWICDALRRCANTEEAREKAPGRELVTFLTIANVSLWVFYTFSVKNSPIKDERYYFYGDRAWSILNHLSLPLIMFYRFHASVCLVDIWRHSYEPGEFAHWAESNASLIVKFM